MDDASYRQKQRGRELARAGKAQHPYRPSLPARSKALVNLLPNATQNLRSPAEAREHKPLTTEEVVLQIRTQLCAAAHAGSDALRRQIHARIAHVRPRFEGAVRDAEDASQRAISRKPDLERLLTFQAVGDQRRRRDRSSERGGRQRQAVLELADLADCSRDVHCFRAHEAVGRQGSSQFIFTTN